MVDRVDWSLVNHFEQWEFDDPGFPGSGELIYPPTVYVMDKIREDTGWPIITHNKFGLRGCVCINRVGHTSKSAHFVPEASAADWHFETDASPREQAKIVLNAGFNGVGIYYDWKWDGKILSIGFHTDFGDRIQLWKRWAGKYYYFLQ